MTRIIPDKMTSDIDHDFAVLLIGMRINKFWKVHKWLPVANAMQRMLDELYQNPDLGLVSHESWFGRTSIMVQYWQSLEQLLAYAHNKNAQHLPAWAAFNRSAGNDVGIWHETYACGKGRYECVYKNMPQFGLAKLGQFLPATGQHKSARGRLNMPESE